MVIMASGTFEASPEAVVLSGPCHPTAGYPTAGRVPDWEVAQVELTPNGRRFADIGLRISTQDVLSNTG